MEPFKQRVLDERDELRVKLSKLAAFLETDFFAELDENSRRLLYLQQSYMTNYLDILDARIKYFTLPRAAI